MIERPVLQWHGGKWLLAKWIISHFPEHHSYVEPFGGAASVLLQKTRCHTEVYNDLDDEVVNLFQVLRHPGLGHQLARQIELTPFSRKEFKEAYERTLDPIERARRLIIRSFMGHGSAGHSLRKTGFRSNAMKAGTSPAQDWQNYPEQLLHIVQRIRGVTIEHMDAIALMKKHDGPTTLFYVDPPYLPSTRDAGTDYRVEMTIDQHKELLAVVRELEGMVVMSGYMSEIYETNLTGWKTSFSNSHADGGRDRLECIWINPACNRAQLAPGLFD